MTKQNATAAISTPSGKGQGRQGASLKNSQGVHGADSLQRYAKCKKTMGAITIAALTRACDAK